MDDDRESLRSRLWSKLLSVLPTILGCSSTFYLFSVPNGIAFSLLDVRPHSFSLAYAVDAITLSCLLFQLIASVQLERSRSKTDFAGLMQQAESDRRANAVAGRRSSSGSAPCGGLYRTSMCEPHGYCRRSLAGGRRPGDSSRP